MMKKTSFLKTSQKRLGAFFIGLFVLTVFYYGLIASDRFETDVRFIVRQEHSAEHMALDLGAVLSGGVKSDQDAYLIRDYIVSYDMWQALDEKLHIKAHYQSSDIDIISRLKSEPTTQEIVEYYQEHVTLDIDPVSGVAVLAVQAYEPEIAEEMVTFILARSEIFINDVSQALADEQQSFVKAELGRATERLRGIKQQMIRFQNDHALFSPTEQAGALSSLIGKLEAELAEQKTRMKELQSFAAKESMEMVAVTRRISALQAQIEQERSRVVGAEAGETLNLLAAEFENLKMELSFALDIYKATLTSLEKVRLDASRKMKHLVVITTPKAADSAEYPRRVYWTVTIGLFLFLLYGVARLIMSVVADHKMV